MKVAAFQIFQSRRRKLKQSLATINFSTIAPNADQELNTALLWTILLGMPRKQGLELPLQKYRFKAR